MLEQWIETLTKEMRLQADLPKDSLGNYILPLDEASSVAIGSIPGGFVLFSTLGPLPPKVEEFFKEAMLANLFGQGTKGAVLGLSNDGLKVTLSQEVPNAKDYREFRDILEDFLNTVDFWTEEAKTK